MANNSDTPQGPNNQEEGGHSGVEVAVDTAMGTLRYCVRPKLKVLVSIPHEDREGLEGFYDIATDTLQGVINEINVIIGDLCEAIGEEPEPQERKSDE